jgi:hypothetical protein
MRRFAFHLVIPTLVTLGAFLRALRYQSFGLDMLATYVLAGFFFYSAPYLLWGLVAVIGRFSTAVGHAGFVAATVALLYILLLSFTAHDPSGLPLQWLAYWAIALFLQVVFVAVTAVYVRSTSQSGA